MDSAQGNCSDDASPDTPDPNDGELQVCLTVSIFDTWGTQEEDVTLDQSASISLMMDAEDLGGVEMVEDAYKEGGFITYIREGVDDDWSMVEFTLSTDDDGVVTITVTGVTRFSSFAQPPLPMSSSS